MAAALAGLVLLPAAGLAQASLPAARLATGTLALEFLREPRGTPIATVTGLDLGRAAGIRIRLGSPVPCQLRLLWIEPDGATRERLVVLTPGVPVQELALARAAFDPTPAQTWTRVPPGGTLLLADQPGLRRVSDRGMVELGPLTVLDEAPPRAADEEPGTAPLEPVEDRLLGAWIGKTLGCEVGMPREGREAPDWPALEAGWEGLVAGPDRTVGFGPDDDTSLAVQTLLVGERRGSPPGPMNLAGAWLATFAPEWHWENSWQALLRVRQGIRPPESGRIPLGISLSARIRIDPWGMLFPGRPATAACFAGQDASLTSHGVGVDDARFVAATLAAALAAPPTAPVETLVEAGLAGLPGAYPELVREVFAGAGAGVPLREAYARVRARTWEAARALDPARAWAFSLPNAGLMALALAYGRGDPAASLALAATLGWDADCNAGSVGLVLGARVGASGLPPALRDRVEDRLRVAVAGHEHWSLTALARRTATLARRMAGAECEEPHPPLTDPPAGDP